MSPHRPRVTYVLVRYRCCRPPVLDAREVRSIKKTDECDQSQLVRECVSMNYSPPRRSVWSSCVISSCFAAVALVGCAQSGSIGGETGSGGTGETGGSTGS